MSDNFQRTLNRWLESFLGLKTIKARGGGDRPTGNYLMTNITDAAPLYQVPRDLQREAFDVPDENGGTAETITDMEYRVSVHAYRQDPCAILLPLVGVKHLEQTMRPMLPWKLQEVGRIQSVPELVKTEWEERAVVRLIFHGIHRENQPGDVAETVAEITAAEAQT